MNQANKEARVLEALKLPAGLNRFDAELIGDHCLNSTVAKLRAKGWVIRSEAELVKTRYSEAGARVLRYRCSGRIGGAE